jgi:hypothetical protein
MGLIVGWARRSNERAVANAREAATLASRRRLETAEVAAYLASRQPVTAVAAVAGEERAAR